MNRLSNPPTWVGSSTDFAKCIRALEKYQPDSVEDLEQQAITEIGIHIPELRNVFRYERGTQQKWDDYSALTSLFEYPEYELPFQCPPNSPSELLRDVSLDVLTPRMLIRRLCGKFYSNVRARTIVYYTGVRWDQPYVYLDAAPGYNPMLQDYDTVARRHVLEHALVDFYCLPNLADYVSKRELGMRFPRISKMPQLYNAHDHERNPHVGNASCSYVPNSASCWDRNARRRALYASMQADKRASLLLAIRSVSIQHEVSLDSAMEFPTSCKGEVSQARRGTRKYHLRSNVLKRREKISSQAWSLPPVDACHICGAAHYLRESRGFYCLRGQISLALPRMPLHLWNLYTSTDSTSAAHFRKRCRTYNNTTTFSSLGITYDHTLAQSNKGNLDFKILEDIVEMMQLNPYANFFPSLRELTNLQDYNIVLRAYPCLDMRIYSLPTAHQVAAIWNELKDIPANHPHDIRVCTSAGKTHRVHYYYGCYDPLQYPLLFPYVESGWHTGIVKLAPVSNGYQGQQYHKCDGQNLISLDQEHCGESVLAHELQKVYRPMDWFDRGIYAGNLTIERMLARAITTPYIDWFDRFVYKCWQDMRHGLV
ncbi:hypothetical protein OROMI_004292 [Orobanche minor]